MPLTINILTDLTRLPEIYALRVAAWEQSPGQPYVNHELFPQGWSDVLDNHPTVRHWVVEDEGQIVAAARIVLLDILAESGEPDLVHLPLPPGRPYGYYELLVIAPPYRKTGLAQAFDAVCTAYLQSAGAAFGIGITPLPSRWSSFQEVGWTMAGTIQWTEVASALTQPGDMLCLWQPTGLV